MNELYTDPSRKVGSQSEAPTAWMDGEYICFDGYQRFCLSKGGRIRLGKQEHKKKYGMIRPYLKAMTNSSDSLIDLGCSAGVMGFQACLDGYSDVVFVDHDAEYLSLVQSGLVHIGADGPLTEQSKVQELSRSADVMFVFALIHWLYSCTEEFGSLERIVAALALRCRQVLFIEWVGPECNVVKKFGHISRNPGVHETAYTKDNFVDALRSHYSNVCRIGSVRRGREIWIASNRPVSRSMAVMFVERLAYLGWRARTWAFQKVKR